MFSILFFIIVALFVPVVSMFAILPMLTQAYNDSKMRTARSYDVSNDTDTSHINMTAQVKMRFVVAAIALLGWFGGAVQKAFRDFPDFATFLKQFNILYTMENLVPPVVFLVLLFILYLAMKKPELMNKSLWGMSEAQDGRLIDESLTKHKIAVYILLFIIFIGTPLTLFVYLKYFIPQ